MYKPKACVVCGKIFQPTSGYHLYCSKECRAPIIRAGSTERHRQWRKDPAYRAKDAEIHRVLRATKLGYREKANAHLTKRYAEDTEYRERKKIQRKLNYDKDDRVFGMGAVVSEFVGSFAGWCCLHILAVHLSNSYVKFENGAIFLAISAVVGMAGYSYKIASLVDKFRKG